MRVPLLSQGQGKFVMGTVFALVVGMALVVPFCMGMRRGTRWNTGADVCRYHIIGATSKRNPANVRKKVPLAMH